MLRRTGHGLVPNSSPKQKQGPTPSGFRAPVRGFSRRSSDFIQEWTDPGLLGLLPRGVDIKVPGALDVVSLLNNPRTSPLLVSS